MLKRHKLITYNSSMSFLSYNFAYKFKRLSVEVKNLNRIKVVLAEKAKTGRSIVR